MNEEIIARLQSQEQRINLLQASVDSLAVLVSQLLVGQLLPQGHDFSDEQIQQLVRARVDGYGTMRDQRSSKLSEFPFLSPEPPSA